MCKYYVKIDFPKQSLCWFDNTTSSLEIILRTLSNKCIPNTFGKQTVYKIVKKVIAYGLFKNANREKSDFFMNISMFLNVILNMLLIETLFCIQTYLHIVALRGYCTLDLIFEDFVYFLK